MVSVSNDGYPNAHGNNIMTKATIISGLIPVEIYML